MSSFHARARLRATRGRRERRLVSGRLVGVSEVVHSLANCRICTNGDLVFSVLTASARVIVECRECMTGYLDPRNVGASATMRMETADTRATSKADVEAAGATDLIMD